MDLTPYVSELRRQVLVAAEAGGDEARLVAERITTALDAATRLVLLEALAAAAADITAELAPGSVEVRLRGCDPELVVVSPPAGSLDDASSHPVDRHGSDGRGPVAPGPVDDDGGTCRITLRLPEHLKLRIEAAAGLAGLSVNAWLVRTIADGMDPADAGRRAPSGGQRYSGWAR